MASQYPLYVKRKLCRTFLFSTASRPAGGRSQIRGRFGFPTWMETSEGGANTVGHSVKQERRNTEGAHGDDQHLFSYDIHIQVLSSKSHLPVAQCATLAVVVRSFWWDSGIVAPPTGLTCEPGYFPISSSFVALVSTCSGTS